MLEVCSLNELKKVGILNLSLACGNFDGIHLGHQAIIKKTIQQAIKYSSTPALLTFSPHPRFILKNKHPLAICSDKEKRELLKKLGIKVFINIKFTKKLSKFSASDFVEKFFHNSSVKISSLCVGEKWRFAHNKEGNIKFLENFFSGEVCVMPQIKLQGMIVSSTLIRELLIKGDFPFVSQALGRDYYVEGYVVKGKQIASKKLNVPTANVNVKNAYLPVQGVFFVEVLCQKKSYKGICNIGYNPSVENLKNKRVEVHCLLTKQSFYKKKMKLSFLKRLRDEKKFLNIGELKQQIIKDIEKAKIFFANSV